MARIRYQLTHPKGLKNLQIYEDAVGMMKGEKPLSKSALQSDIRTVLDKDKDKFIDKDSPFNWVNYSNIHRDNCAHFTPHFLAWHRVYIHYFENAVRTITGESKFTLPYWNYNDPAQRKLPEAFADPTSALYEKSRHKDINKRTVEIESIQMDEDDSLYVNPQSYENFGAYLELHPHSDFHFQIGGIAAPTGTSAQDPIFWMNHNNLDRLWAKHAPFAISIEDFKNWPTEYRGFDATYIFTDSNGDKTADLINEPKKVLQIIQRKDVQYQDQDADGNDIFIPIKPPKTTRGLDLSQQTLSPCFYDPDSCLPTTVWEEEVKPLEGLKQNGILIDLSYSENRQLTKDPNFKTTLNITFSLEEEMPAMINVFYGDQPKDPAAGTKQTATLPSKNKSFDKLINNPKSFNKYFAGNITIFANDPGTGHTHHHSNTHDELISHNKRLAKAGRVSFDITSLIQRQKNDPNINDQIFFNLDPTQKYASEIAEAFNIEYISIEHFTIPDPTA